MKMWDEDVEWRYEMKMWDEGNSTQNCTIN